MSTVTVSLADLQALVTQVFIHSQVAPDIAAEVAAALVAANADGLASHGVARTLAYAEQAQAGKVNGHAQPVLDWAGQALLRVDACYGFAFPAVRRGLDAALEKLDELGCCAVSITRSHHFGVAGHPVERAAQQGYMAMAFSNSPAAMAPWGGNQGSFGTNPIAFACPVPGEDPLVVDLSLSKVARGKVMVAAQNHQPIPEGWALDPQGQPTTDAEAALAGTMIPLGDAKGAALALMVEILSAGLSGGNFAFQASSFFNAEGPPPGIGQLMILFAPQRFNPGFAEHLQALFGHMLGQEGVRLPGRRRQQLRQQAQQQGVSLPTALYESLQTRAGG